MKNEKKLFDDGVVEKRRSQMTSAERANLCSIARQRAKLAKRAIEAHALQQMAHVEQQLAAEYCAEDAKWKDIVKEAEVAVHAADKKIAAICKARGVPESFRPQLSLNWYGRGENAVRSRRDELRRVARSTIDSRIAAAKQKVDTTELQILTNIMTDGLTSEKGMEHLNEMPSVNQLMPTLQLAEIKALQPFSDSTDPDDEIELHRGLDN